MEDNNRKTKTEKMKSYFEKIKEMDDDEFLDYSKKIMYGKNYDLDDGEEHEFEITEWVAKKITHKFKAKNTKDMIDKLERNGVDALYHKVEEITQSFYNEEDKADFMRMKDYEFIKNIIEGYNNKYGTNLDICSAKPKLEEKLLERYYHHWY